MCITFRLTERKVGKFSINPKKKREKNEHNLDRITRKVIKIR